jgi:hypothetical protein
MTALLMRETMMKTESHGIAKHTLKPMFWFALGCAPRARETPAKGEPPMSQTAVNSAPPTPRLARRLALLPFFLYANVPPPAHRRQRQ